MKNTNYLVLAMLGCTLISQSCKKDNVLDEIQHSETNVVAKNGQYFADTKYNKRLEIGAKAVSIAVKESQEFRELIKVQCLKKFDGDYNVLLRDIKDIILTHPTNQSQITVNNYINGIVNNIDLDAKYPNYLEELTSDHPLIQIAIPVHINDFDPSKDDYSVLFTGERFDEATTKECVTYRNGSIYGVVSGIHTPDQAHVVLSLNERVASIQLVSTSMPIPSNVTCQALNDAIEINWNSNGANSSTVDGYRVYKKLPANAGFELIGDVEDYFDTHFTDNNVEGNVTQTYMVRSYHLNSHSVSQASNLTSCSSPTNPTSTTEFSATNHSLNTVELTWSQDVSAPIQQTHIYKNVVATGNATYTLHGSFSPTEYGTFDQNVQPGQKIKYKIQNVNNQGGSNYQYDYVKIPYRDVSQNSVVKLRKIDVGSKCDVESWWNGDMEFFLSVGNIEQVGEPYWIAKKLDFRYSHGGDLSQDFNQHILDWSPGFFHDILTFHLIEYDHQGSLSSEASVDFTAKGAEKNESLFDEVEFSSNLTYEIKSGDENCGTGYLSYYQNPAGWVNFQNFGARIYFSE